VLNNSQHQLHIGELLQAKVINPTTEDLWIPEDAVYRLGERKVVFIKKDNVLTAKEVQTGITSGKQIQIKNGLQKSDEIAANAAYLIDTESFIQIN
jgi:Cu(I)/Ag(I) efflux system membrane fusion protein